MVAAKYTPFGVVERDMSRILSGLKKAPKPQKIAVPDTLQGIAWDFVITRLWEEAVKRIRPTTKLRLHFEELTADDEYVVVLVGFTGTLR